MAVIKTREVTVQKGIKDVFNRIENFFRKMQEVIITSSELQEESGTFTITFNRTLKSNGEVMTINLTKVEENLTEIFIQSESTVKKTVTDWGKNEQNIRYVLDLFGLEGKK
jgi:stress response protein SCP2